MRCRGVDLFPVVKGKQYSFPPGARARCLRLLANARHHSERRCRNFECGCGRAIGRQSLITEKGHPEERWRVSPSGSKGNQAFLGAFKHQVPPSQPLSFALPTLGGHMNPERAPFTVALDSTVRSSKKALRPFALPSFALPSCENKCSGCSGRKCDLSSRACQEKRDCTAGKPRDSSLALL